MKDKITINPEPQLEVRQWHKAEIYDLDMFDE